MDGNEGLVPMRVVDVRLELPSNQPIVLLKEMEGDRYLPIWIGAPEATAIATALEKVTTPRPLTHDLLRSVIDVLGGVASKVVISEMRDSIFFADITFDTGEGRVDVSSRPSDAIALAVRTGTPIFALPAVLDEASILLDDTVDQEEEVARFREFLSEATVEDFLGGQEQPDE